MRSDKCSVERGSGKDTERCFRTGDQKWHPEMIDTYKRERTCESWSKQFFGTMGGQGHG
jgi:hypothetical protein